MAMLAGPRRKQKVINLRVKNNAWSNDSSKFGQRMLEKMGWSSGKGLGAKENGIVEHVVARYKNDDRGLGFEDKNDQWTKHEDEFDALLANLSSAEKPEEKTHSGVSLEVKSKKSKARIHYHKFTRGKDLSRYSEKDLANIFGKKSLKNEVNGETEILNDDIKTTEQVFTEKGSMEDYFKRKLTALKGKANSILLENKVINRDEDVDYGFKGFSGGMDDETDEKLNNDSKIQPFSFYGSSTNIDKTKDSNNDNCIEIIKKKNKKSKECKFNENSNEIGEEITKKKKKKQLENKCPVVDSQDQQNEVQKDKRDKKSKKILAPELNEYLEVNTRESIDQNAVEIENKGKKSKKKKLKGLVQVDDEKVENLPKKKKMNHISEDTLGVQDPVIEESNVPKKKKKRKNKDVGC